MTATFIQTGGARLGMFKCKLAIRHPFSHAQLLRLSCLGREYSLPKSSIRRLGRHRGMLSAGLRIEHTDSSLPEFIVFSPVSRLEWALGYLPQNTRAMRYQRVINPKRRVPLLSADLNEALAV